MERWEDTEEPRVIAEAGMCDKSLGWALEAVEAAADAGCWAFKVQILRPETLVHPDARAYHRSDRISAPQWQVEAFEDGIPYDSWGEVAEHCNKFGLEFFASVWDFEGLDVLRELGCKWVKIGSGDLTYVELISEAIQDFDLFISTGAADFNRTNSIFSTIQRSDPFFRSPAIPISKAGKHHQVVPMACTLAYPAEVANVARMREVMRLHGVSAVGYSDHTTSLITGGLAVSWGAKYLEKHFTISPGKGGDHDFALDPDQMAEYCQIALEAHKHWGEGMGVTAEEEAASWGARRCMYAIADIEVGDRLAPEVNIRWLRPRVPGAIEPDSDLGGGVFAVRFIPEGSAITWDDCSPDFDFHPS